MMDENEKLPNAEPDTLGDPKVLKMARADLHLKERAPQIRWGDEYKAWPIERRLAYAENLASSMNHAADLLQQERDAQRALIAQQADQLKGYIIKVEKQGQLMQNELAKAGAEKQELYEEIVRLGIALKEARQRIAVLEHESGLMEHEKTVG